MSNIPIALTIAGSDSGGGAGIQADLKSFSANGAYGASVITALTAQNTLGVTTIHDVPAEFIAEQLDAVFSDLKIDAVKIGMLSQVTVVETVAKAVEKFEPKHVVLDPVMVATSGDSLLADDAVEAIKSTLMPFADVVTPNLHEAAKLTIQSMVKTPDEMIEQGNFMRSSCNAKSVLMKGGHGDGDECVDILCTANGNKIFKSDRIDTKNTHGTGCSLSSAIASHLARGLDMEQAIQKSKHWLTEAIRHSDELEIGNGSGPVHHFHALWSKT